jgi:hypothetical protein
MDILYCWQRMHGEVNSAISGKGKLKNAEKWEFAKKGQDFESGMVRNSQQQAMRPVQ